MKKYSKMSPYLNQLLNTILYMDIEIPTTRLIVYTPKFDKNV